MAMMKPVDRRINHFASHVDRSIAYQLTILGLITLLATALRFYKLGEWGFWIDEEVITCFALL